MTPLAATSAILSLGGAPGGLLAHQTPWAEDTEHSWMSSPMERPALSCQPREP